MKFIEPAWPAPTQVKAYTTSRLGWGGRESEQQLTALLDLPDEPIWITQTHSAIALKASPENREQKADATFTDEPNRICAVMTADCLPVLICNRHGTHVAAVHAGWRGLALGIIEATIEAMQQPRQELLVWLGPAIGPKKFEVGKDVYDAFIQKNPQSARAFVAHAHEKWHADLYELAKIRLHGLGIHHIYGGNFCTYTQDDLFFSYRRDKGQTGRMASLIWIEKKK